MAKVSTSVYIVLEPQYGYNGQVIGLRADRMIASKPQKLSMKHIAFKLNVSLDAKAFEQFIPEATVSITDGRALVTPVVAVEEPEVDSPEAVA